MDTRRMFFFVLALAVAPLTRAPADPSGSTGSARQAGSTAEERPATESGAQKQATSHTIVGTVEKVKGDALTVRSSKLSDPYEVTLRDDTSVMHEGQSISKDRIAEGDQIRATFVGAAESGDATEIVVIKKGEGKAVKGAEPTTAGAPEKKAPPPPPSRTQ